MDALYVCVLLSALSQTAALTELLDNPDFEDVALGKWFPIGEGVKLTLVREAVSGLKSLRVTQR